MSKILIVGGTGMLGEPVARQLKRDGFSVKIMSRNPEKAAKQLGAGFEFVAGDVQNLESLREVLGDCEGVHVNLAGGPTPADYDRIEHCGTANVAKAAAEMGVNRISYLSGFSVCQENSHHYATKAKYDAENAIKASGVSYTIFRASWFMESFPLFIQGKRAMIIGNQRTPLHWMAAADYACMVSNSFRLPAAANQTFYVGGPEAVSMTDAVTQYCQLVRPDVKVSRIPVWLFSLLTALSRDEGMKDIGRFMAYSAQITETGSFETANAMLGLPTTTLQDWFQTQMSNQQAQPVLA
ncbi:MAG: NAD-dependent epimerase/dehydratase family protein [Chloroflexi bacterium]|nr:MAG: NAD-dependent epimerase/dehydratase family protein [Chloroflexota bacterium]